MLNFILYFAMIIAGIYLLVKGSEFLIDGSVKLAKKLGMSMLLVGFTVVALGTSLPELFVSLIAGMNNSSSIQLANIIGSNISNILLILGISAILQPLYLKHATIWKEIPFCLMSAIVLFIISADIYFTGSSINIITLSEGIILLIFLIIFLYYLVESNKNAKTNLGVEEAIAEVKAHPYKNNYLWKILLGVILLYAGGELTVKGIISLAEIIGLSKILIASTVVAIGTSLPELVTALTAIKRHKEKALDLIIGDVIGSNIINILFVLGLSAIIKEIIIPSTLLVDCIILIFVTLVLFVSLFLGQKHKLVKKTGIIYLILYVLYLAFLFFRG